LQAIKWVGELGLNNVIFNLDAKSVVDSFNKTTHDLSYFGFIIKDCKSYLLNLCSNSLVEFSRRQATMEAHKLAMTAIYMDNSHVFELMPNCILTYIINDMLSLLS
jgi:hypothetical protein